VEDVKRVRKEYPDYTLLVHPECSPEIFEQADLVASTKGMADFVKEHDNVILGTEVGLYEQLKKFYPEKKLIPLSAESVCLNMKKTTLQDVFETLKSERNEIFIENEIAKKAVRSIQRMLEIS
jgi:quinolinate synthase